MEEHDRESRHPFHVNEDRDYSALTIEGTAAVGVDLARSFFNGANLISVRFEGCNIRNTELTEVVARSCEFIGCNLTGSDLINSRFEGSTFVDCNLSNGEWRESSFVGCRFLRCKFAHATVTLSEFSRCEMDADTLASADNRSFHYNVFSRSTLPVLGLSDSLTSRNFGLPAASEAIEPNAIKANSISLEELCHLNNTGRFHVVDLADAVRGLTRTIEASGSRRNSALAFFGRIIRALTTERRISATSLFYIEAELSDLASATDDQEVLLATMGAMVEARTALLRIAAESEETEAQPGQCRSIIVHFSPTYPRQHADALSDTLNTVAGGGAELEMRSFENGSTIIEIVSVGAVTTTTVLSTLNVVLRQATVTVKRFGELKDAWRKHVTKSPAPRRKSRALVSPKVPAILNPDSASPRLATAKAAVRRHGRVLVELDEPASITLFVKAG